MSLLKVYENVDRYIKICEEEARVLTGIEFCTWDPKGRPTLDFRFQEGKGWTSVQIFFVHEQMQYCAHSFLLIELYHEDPIHLYQQFKTAHELYDHPLYLDNIPPSNEIDRLLKEFPKCLAPALDLPQFRQFLTALLPIQEGKETTFRRLATETAGLVLDRRGKSKAFDTYINAEWRPKILETETGGSTPFLTGLFFIFSRQLDEFQKNCVKYIKTEGRPRYDNRLAKPVFLENVGRQFDQKLIQIALAPSGSGKTTSIFNELTRFYGYYMVSCALPKYKDIQAEGLESASSRDLRGTIMDPKVLQGVSEDTRELFTMLKQIKSLSIETCGFEESDVFHVCARWWARIVETRQRVFHWFREALASDSTPALWLSFQLNCSEWDPFLQIFRVTSLFPLFGIETSGEASIPLPQYCYLGHYHKSIVLSCLSNIDKDVHWACIDEVQEDIRATLQNSNMLAACMTGINSQRFEQNDFIYFRQLIFAGTSLNVSKALQTRKELLGKNRGYIGAVWDKNACNIAIKFPLIMNRNTAEALLKLYGLDGAANAVDQSEPL
ncbi:MAG: hypothetical protein Q9187_003345 [Circinaria calcarea]